jgi:hypothetical protein
VTRRARAVTATGVIQVNAVIQRDIQDRTLKTMLFVRHCFGIELNRDIRRQESYLGHTSIIASHHYPAISILSIGIIW